jgi:hypothetical protein
MGLHQVYAAGFAVKDQTELQYIELGDSSENFVNRFFKHLFNFHKNLDGYTFYIHNLGRFDSIFIVKALSRKKDFILVPI